MNTTAKHDAWSAGKNYEIYMGRWSSILADKFVSWLNPSSGLEWIDIGCGTGALSRAILSKTDPVSVIGVDPSKAFADHADALTNDERAEFREANAEQLPLEDSSVDVSASGLVLNFIPDKAKALGEMRRVTRAGGTVCLYVWDYPNGGIDFIDQFWKCAAELDTAAIDLDEANRFPFCTKAGIGKIFEEAGFQDKRVEALEIETPFATFEDFLNPFTLGAGPAPGYFVSLSEEGQRRLTSLLAERLGEGPIGLKARAWAVVATN